MGFSSRYTLVLLAWVGALWLALLALLWTFEQPDLGVARLVAGVLVLSAIVGLVRHVDRTNVTVARFVEALRHGDFGTRFDSRGGAGFSRLGEALDTAMRDLQQERTRIVEEARFQEALVNDIPVALLTVDDSGTARLVNKAARRLFGASEILDAEQIARVGATFAMRLTDPGPVASEVVILRLSDGPQRALLRADTLERLGLPVRVVTVEPAQSTLDTIEVAAQTDLVRVLTHEILNSLTPVTSLAESAAALLAATPTDLPEARLAVETLSRRATGLHRFIQSYRAVARPPSPRPRTILAAPFAAELVRLFRADWPRHRVDIEVLAHTTLHADPDLFAQALLNLLRNAAQATGSDGRVALRIADSAAGTTVIEIEDDGPGIAEELRADIFLPFFTTRAEGTGVGLNLVRQIVVSHGWRIDVATGSLGGALFRLTGP